MILARRIAAVVLMILIVGGIAPAAKQASSPQSRGAAAAAPGQPQPAQAPAPNDRTAEETREQLMMLLEKYPPALGRVLKLDPSLLASQPYLEPYPALASFLAAHPEVARNPGYFLAAVQTPDSAWRPTDARGQAMEIWRTTFEDIGAFLIFLVITSSLIWLIRTLLDWRRWTRMARSQAEVHAKLLDRFTANEDLLTYIQTPVGRRFLESGPVLAEAGPRPLGAPISRILWSLQAGIVLAVLGVGLLFASGLVIPEVGQGLTVLGVLAIALGVGFILSAVAAWLISRRMGLFESLMAPGPGRDVNAV